MRPRIAALLLILAAGAGTARGAAPQDPYHLKPGARGKLCLECHVTFQDTVKLPSIHTPVRQGDCTKCHSPHASSHGRLLADDTGSICLTCHAGTVPAEARSTHAPARDGACIKCHDPHGAANAKNLRTAGRELCAGCHADLVAFASSAAFKHAPVEKSCLGCHDPHASRDAPSLLKKDVAALCSGCHRTDQPAFAKQHAGYPVAKGRCTSCHNPHGSQRSGLLWPTVHPPLTNKMCAQCHRDAGAPDALSTRKEGFELCRGCHSSVVNDALSKSHIHWPAVDRVGCLNCHSPHASSQPALLRKPLKPLCGTCHADTIERQAASPTKHPPIDQGECLSCHAPHASDNGFLLQEASIVGLCGTCHDYKKHSSHPIGEKFADPRNVNLTVDCLSCHRSHGSPYKSFAPFDPDQEMCVQCHRNLSR